MATDDPATMTDEQLRAELAQQRRLNAMLREQLARLLDEVARLTKKKPAGKRPKKKKSDPRGEVPDPGAGDAPTAPESPAEAVAEPSEKTKPRRGTLPQDLERTAR